MQRVAAENFIHRERILEPNAEGDVDQQGERPVGGVEDKGVERLVVETPHGEAVAGVVA